MYKTSTFFIKGQTPSLTTTGLLNILARELGEQGAGRITTDNNTLHFRSDSSSGFFFRSTNRFSSFSKGTIFIEETDTEFLVSLEADLTNMLIPRVFLRPWRPLYFCWQEVSGGSLF